MAEGGHDGAWYCGNRPQFDERGLKNYCPAEGCPKGFCALDDGWKHDEPSPDRCTGVVAKTNAPVWTEWRERVPEPGCKFIVAHDDGCSSGIFVMLDDGPHNAEDGENYGMDAAVLWMPLPAGYPIRFMEITEDDWR